MIRKNQKKHDKIVLLVRTELNTIDALICEALINLYISHAKFVLEYNMMI